jgi:hypothetical protein
MGGGVLCLCSLQYRYLVNGFVLKTLTFVAFTQVDVAALIT